MADNRGAGPPERAGASVVTVLVAGAANLAVAIAKAVAGLLTGSAAMLSEAAHSLADTMTEALLFTSLRRGARPADTQRPFGYGKERYLWALLAALSTFLVGAGFSVARGLDTIRAEEPYGRFGVSYAVLAVAFAVESVSLTRAVRQVRREARRWRVSPLRYLRVTADTAVKAVALEDSAALVGLTLAASGLWLTQVTGSPLWDGIASIAIGGLLVAVAATLALANVSLLVGRSVPDEVREDIRNELTSLPAVDSVPTLLTMLLGPNEVLVAAKIDFADDASGADIKAAADEAERRLTARLPGILHLFLDPTKSGGQIEE